MIRKLLTPGVIGLAALLAALPLLSCGRSNSNKPASPTEPTAQSSPSPVKTGLEADLDYVRRGQYTYVLVFSRKDGKPLDKNDGAYLRTNAPQVVDWVTTDQGKKVIAGTNFDLEKGNMNLLKKRFVVEDYTSR
jgi:hypothetical protein